MRWMLRNATFEDVLSVRQDEQLRMIPGAKPKRRIKTARTFAHDASGAQHFRLDRPTHSTSRKRATSLLAVKTASKSEAPHYLTATRAQSRIHSLGDLSDSERRDEDKMSKNELYRRAKDLYTTNSLIQIERSSRRLKPLHRHSSANDKNA